MQELLRVPFLPNEVLWNVVLFLTSCTPEGTDGSSEHGSFDNFSKPPWTDVYGISMSSKSLRSMTLRDWFRVLHVKNDDDWKVYTEKYPFVFKYTTSIVWHGTVDDEPWLDAATAFFKKFTFNNGSSRLRSVRIILPVPEDFLFDLEYRPTFSDYMKALSQAHSSVHELEVFNDTYPSPEVMRFIADAVPEVRVLRLKQPAVWCSLCFTCSIPRFARAHTEVIRKKLEYKDGRGLPALWASRLATLTNLHTIEITTGVIRGVRRFDDQVEKTYSWSGECEMCLMMMDRDTIFRETTLETKRNNVNLPKNLKTVEWKFQTMSEFGDSWSRVRRQLYE